MGRKLLFLALLLLVIVILSSSASAAPIGSGEEKSQIIVKSSTTNRNGVVIITAEEGKQTLELQCNEGTHGCTVAQAGRYWMVRLPKNRGLYDCANVELYQFQSGSEPEEKVGQYCLTRTE